MSVNKSIQKLICEEVQRNLWSYSKNLVPEDKKDAINDHLSTCKECQDSLRKLKGNCC